MGKKWAPGKSPTMGRYTLRYPNAAPGVIGNSIDDAIEKLRQSYDYIGDDGHRHHEDTPRFNIILGSDGN